MHLILSLIFLVLLLLVGKKRGLKTYICFYINYLLIMIYIILCSFGIDPIILAIITCLLVSLVTLFILNGNNIKTLSSFISILLILLLELGLIIFINNNANIYGFSYEQMESIGVFSFDINYSMKKLFLGVILMSSIGTVIDTSISISSSLNEVYLNNPKSTIKDLYISGINIGRDILSTTINTLYFVFLGGFMAFLFWHIREDILFVINYKVFVFDTVELLLCFISSIIVIPVTSIVTSYLLKNKKVVNYYHQVNS